MAILVFPNTLAGSGEGSESRPVLPSPYLEWIINQLHRVLGDDPRTAQVEGKVNELARSLLENDRALLDFITALESYVYVFQSALSSLRPGPNRYHADNTFRGVHQDLDIRMNLTHTDSLVYNDTILTLNNAGEVIHDDFAFVESHFDRLVHGDTTVTHHDFHSDHSDHFDQGHGDASNPHSDHSDHLDISHADSHGDYRVDHQDEHSDRTYSDHANVTTVHDDIHSDHWDIRSDPHCDTNHLDHTDNRNINIPHGNFAHFDEYNHSDYGTHDDAWQWSHRCAHLDVYAYHSDTVEYTDYVNHTDCQAFTDNAFSDHSDHSDHANYQDHANAAHQDTPGHTDNYQDHANVAHCDNPHLDHNDHANVHGDIPSSHTDYFHGDHQDSHSDLPLYYGDVHADQAHTDHNDHANIAGSHTDTSHLDSNIHNDQHSDVPGSHSNHGDHSDHTDAGAGVVHKDGLVHGDSYFG